MRGEYNLPNPRQITVQTLEQVHPVRARTKVKIRHHGIRLEFEQDLEGLGNRDGRPDGHPAGGQ